MKVLQIPFPENEYIPEVTKKEMIVLHHTVSGSGKYVPDWWKSDKGTSRVATAFIVEKDGTIYQLFNARHWAYHIGKGSTKVHNQRSIGIEIVNEGPLVEKDGKYFWFDGKKEYLGEVITHSWRGFEYWASYNNTQIDAAAELVNHLCAKHDIEKNLITDYEYDSKYLQHKGIVSHHNLRKDKTDVSPAFDLVKFKEKLKNEFGIQNQKSFV